MGFTLVGALFTIPIILTYTAWSYHVFRQGEGRRRLSPLIRSATDMRQTLRRAGWLVLIWTASVTAMGAIAFLFRLMMQASGLTL